MKQFTKQSARCCPKCSVKPGKSWLPKNSAKCTACKGKTRAFDWWENDAGEWEHKPELTKR